MINFRSYFPGFLKLLLFCFWFALLLTALIVLFGVFCLVPLPVCSGASPPSLPKVSDYQTDASGKVVEINGVPASKRDDAPNTNGVRPPNEYEWQWLGKDPAHLYLFMNRSTIGVYFRTGKDAGKYRPYADVTGGLLPPREPPYPVPAQFVVRAAADEPTPKPAPTPAPAPPTPSPFKAEWKHDGEDPEQLLLMQVAPKQTRLGVYHRRGEFVDCYRPYLEDGTSLGEPTTPPLPVPDSFKVQNFGVDFRKNKSFPENSINGAPVTRDEVFKKLAEQKKPNPSPSPTPKPANGIPNDASKLRLTIFGQDAARAKVLEDLKSVAALQVLRDTFVVQDYAPGDWAAQCGFVVDADVVIYLQSPDGKVLHRQRGYDGGAEKLAEAIRRADPNYQPVKDPDLRKPANPLLPSLPAPFNDLPLSVWLAGGLGVYLLMSSRNANTSSTQSNKS